VRFDQLLDALEIPMRIPDQLFDDRLIHLSHPTRPPGEII
jgi:hypothetical protein